MTARRRVYEQARGIEPPLTKEQEANKARNTRYILEQQMKAHNQEIEDRRKPRVKRCMPSAENNAAAYRERRAAGIKDHD